MPPIEARDRSLVPVDFDTAARRLFSHLEPLGFGPSLTALEAETKFLDPDPNIKGIIRAVPLLGVREFKGSFRGVYTKTAPLTEGFTLRIREKISKKGEHTTTLVTLKSKNLNLDPLIKTKWEAEAESLKAVSIAEVVDTLSLAEVLEERPKKRRAFSINFGDDIVHIALDDIPGSGMPTIMEIEANAVETVRRFVDTYGSLLGIDMSLASPLSTGKLLRELQSVVPALAR